MDDLDLAKTISSRIASDIELAHTFIDTPRETIEPEAAATQRNLDALEALRAMCESFERKLVLHRTIGQGGMGVVHLATQTTLGRLVAVKTLREGLGDPDATARILREAWVTGTLEHPSIVPIYDVGVDAAGSPIIVMKLIEGSPWSAVMRDPVALKERFGATDPLEWNLRILTSVCNAVHFAHSRGILHRDLKPDNVMIGAFGEVYVLDWGIAVSLLDDKSGRFPLASEAFDIAGTPGYVAPEMLRGEPLALSARTDVYLLGAIFFEIFAGEPPHSGDGIHAMVTSSLLSVPRYPPNFPAEAQRICTKALSRRPDDRYESAEEFRIAVEAYVQHRGSRKLAHEAKRSLTRLVETIANEPKGEDRSLAIFNLLGECRFGYRSALSAWPENDAARKGLDQALLAVVDHELDEGNSHAAGVLLREVSAPPADVLARVERVSREHLDHDERVRKLEVDLDPSVGSRTRTFIGGVFGTAWTLMPLAGWFYAARGGTETHSFAIGFSFIFLTIALLAIRWARETLSSTLLNRRMARTLALHACAQVLLSCVAWIVGVTPQQGQLIMVFSWGLIQALLAIWVEPWFGVPAAVCAASFVLSAAHPDLRYPLMALANFILTVVLVRVWFPRQLLTQVLERRSAIRKRAREWLRPPEPRDGE